MLRWILDIRDVMLWAGLVHDHTSQVIRNNLKSKKQKKLEKNLWTYSIYYCWLALEADEVSLNPSRGNVTWRVILSRRDCWNLRSWMMRCRGRVARSNFFSKSPWRINSRWEWTDERQQQINLNVIAIRARNWRAYLRAQKEINRFF
jgi:hypothetical protein